MAKMTSPSTGVKIRMYRQGHGDCFLLAFAGRDGRRKKNIYVLIDCGLKPKSEVHGQKVDKVIDDIFEATGGHIDIVIITHEHQDHVNGFAKKRDGEHLFDKITFGQCWLAWTEDSSDELANALRERFRDTLVTLAFAQEKVSSLNGARSVKDRLSDLLGTETGEEITNSAAGGEGSEIIRAYREAKRKRPSSSESALAAASIKGITNKKAMKYVQDRCEKPTAYLRPDRPPKSLPLVKDLKVYALGPPRDQTLLLDLDPEKNEEFHLVEPSGNLALDSASHNLAMAVAPEISGSKNSQPFRQRYRIPKNDVLSRELPDASSSGTAKKDQALEHLLRVYGGENPSTSEPNTAWRRIDEEWLGSVEGLALRLNNEVNNTSLVLAFELPKTGKVLLFTGDAQRGSWIGWSDLEWEGEDRKTITAKNLLERCVLYKVGHHGSHNATLNGTHEDDYANIGWMGQGNYADEFVAMIPANTPWALGKTQPWMHPLPQIEEALFKKACGRVFRTDQDHISRPDSETITDEAWQVFQSRLKEEKLYFEYSIEDK